MDKADMSGNNANSSDFVKKLYKMLEDKTHEDVVRWGNEGDSFVVLENEKFTKSILPKNFKHSNFASFVRQLNKYDFHKVRQNNEDNGQSPYGPGAWEFKHPEFQANKKEALDNIRRKAPAPRKPMPTMEDPSQEKQMDLVQTQLGGTQAHLQHLQDRYEEMAQGHVMLLQQVIQLQKIVKNHDSVMHRVMGFLHSVDAQRRNSMRGGQYMNGGTAGGIGIADLVGTGQDDHPASPLQQASQLLGEFSADDLLSKDLEQKVVEYNFMANYSTPPQEPSNSVTLAPTSGGSSAQMGFASVNHPDPLENLVYPMGHNNGIDPIDSEHIHNIPYSLPPNGVLTPHHPNELAIKSMGDRRRKVALDPGWGPRKPRVLLVEDDNTCARIGTKFLHAFECITETAHDGLEAVAKLNIDPNFDLILMDIIMPNLDGISTTSCIRDMNLTTIPIIAMTSNIRSEDIDMYFRYGMNDVLPKPFTKEGMLRTLEKHLGHLKKPFDGQRPMQHPGMSFTPTSSNAPMNVNMSHVSSSLKDENSPGKSPASSWHSPSQLGASPQTNGPQHYGQPMSAGGMTAGGYSLTPTHPHPQAHFQAPSPAMAPNGSRPGPHRRVLSDMADMINPADEHIDVKRQRLYPPQGNFA